MKKIALLASVGASIATAFNNPTSDTCETVLVEGGDCGPVRVNKSDFDADQASDKPQYKLATVKEAAKVENDVPADPLVGGPPLAAPSAPDFSGERKEPENIDPLKNAAAPTAGSPNQRLVFKEGKKFYVVDGGGNKITDMAPNIDPAGYATEELAWTAIRALPH
jgi:hypothetical protein